MLTDTADSAMHCAVRPPSPSGVAGLASMLTSFSDHELMEALDLMTGAHGDERARPPARALPLCGPCGACAASLQSAGSGSEVWGCLGSGIRPRGMRRCACARGAEGGL